MKAIIEIGLGNAAFGDNDVSRMNEMRNVMDRLMDNAQRGYWRQSCTTARDFNGNTVARMTVMED